MNLKLLMYICLLTPAKPVDKEWRWGVPYLLMGAPSTAKTSSIIQVCERMQAPSETLYLSTHMPEDLSGIPVVLNGKGQRVNFMSEVEALAAKGCGVLVLDELTTARETTQNAAMGLVLERVLAGTKLPNGLRIAAAANPPEQAAAARDLSLPAANRFLHFDVTEENRLGFDETLERSCALARGEAPAAYTEENELGTLKDGEKMVLSRWGVALPRTWRLVKRFLDSAPDRLTVIPPVGNPSRGRAWASKRSWEMGTMAMAAAEALAHPECNADLLTAAIGEDIAGEYIEFVTKLNLPHPTDVISGKWSPDKTRLDTAATAFESATLFILGTTDKAVQAQYVSQYWGVLHKAAVKHNFLDVVRGSIESMVQRGFASQSINPDFHKAANPLLTALGEKFHEHLNFPTAAP
jgi:hypothetical protein